MKTSYNPRVVTAFLKSYGILKPEFELEFHPVRKWRFDLSWPVLNYPTMVPGEAEGSIALEVQGGIFVKGRHSRGASMLKEWEKLNEAAIMGWRILYCQPSDLLTKETAMMLQRILYNEP